VPSVIILNIVMLNVANNPFMLIAIRLSVVMLSETAPKKIALAYVTFRTSYKTFFSSLRQNKLECSSMFVPERLTFPP
jgi:hypothetical protein